MKLVVLGLSLSSSWGNGHATTYRALLKALARRGHDILFLERDVPWYSPHRDLLEPDFCRLAFYSDVAALDAWRGEVAAADAVIVGSYVPDGIEVGNWALRHGGGAVAFYDIDTPITLEALAQDRSDYLSIAQVPRYDLYLSFTGGPTLDRLQADYGSPMARALYCSVDPQHYRPASAEHRWDLSYLGTYSPDRQPMLERLLLAPARQAPHLRFVVAGPQYPADLRWPANVTHIEHVGPAEHPAFYRASRFTLNLTRAAMVAAGYSPSVRLFEAAACGTAIISDQWPGLDTIFGVGALAMATSAADVMRWLEAPDAARTTMARRALRQVTRRHTSGQRAAELEMLLQQAIAAVARRGAATSARGRAYA